MSVSHATPKVRAKSAAVSQPQDPSPEIDLLDLPVNIIEQKLGDAYATVDLLYTISCSTKAGVLLESLSAQTLANALSTVMFAINAAQDAVRRIPPRAVKAVANG